MNDGQKLEIIGDIVSPKAINQIVDLTGKLEVSQKALIDNILAAEKLNGVLARSKGWKDFNVSANEAALAVEKIKKLEKEVTDLTKQLADVRTKSAADFNAAVEKEIKAIEKKAAKTQQLSEKERLEQIRLDEARKKAFDKYEQQMQKAAAAEDKRAQAIANNSRPYILLSNTLETTRKKAQDLAIIYGEESAQFKAAANEVINLDNRLKAIDATLGKHQRNVGNYASGWNGLSNSINQLTREFPAFANSVQTGFMAISNNLPIFFDEIKRTRAEIKALRAEGQQVPGLFRQLISSIFSWGTALSIGVTLLTVYGKEIGEFVAALLKGKGALDDFKERQRLLGEAFKDNSVLDAVKNVEELRINIKLAKDGLIDKSKVLKQYNKTVGETTGEVKSLDDAERQLAKNAEAYVKMTLYKAAAQAALKEAAEQALKSAKDQAENEQNLKKLENLPRNNDKKIQAEEAALQKILVKERKRVNAEDVKDAKERNDQLLSIAKDFQNKAAEIAKQNGFDFFGKDFDTKTKKTKADTSDVDSRISEYEKIRDAAKSVADDEKNSFELRMESAAKYTEALKQLSGLQYELSVVKAKKNNKEILAAQAQFQTDYQKAEIEGRKQLDKILEDQLTAEEKKLGVSYKKQLEALKEEETTKLSYLSNMLANRTITADQYEQKNIELQREYAAKALKMEIDEAQALLDLTRMNADKRAAYEKQLADARIKLSEFTTQKQVEDAKKVAKVEEDIAKQRIKIEQDIRDRKVELSREVANLAAAIVDAGFEHQSRRLQDESDAIDKRKALEIDNVNNSVASEQEKADRIAIIEARYGAQKEIQEQKERQLEERRTRWKKIAAIAEIGIDTAKTVFSISAQAAAIRAQASLLLANPLTAFYAPIALAQVPLVLSQIPLVIGAGVAQVAALAAFEDGGTVLADGPIITGEAGTELRINPDGSQELTAPYANITYAEKGTKIIPHDELMRIMATPSPLPNPDDNDLDLTPLLMAMDKHFAKLHKAIKDNKPQSGMSRMDFYKATNQAIEIHAYMNQYKRNR